MNLKLFSKNELSPRQLDVVRQRMLSPSHASEQGAFSEWNMHIEGMYALFDLDTLDLVGLAEASGEHEASPEYWIDSLFRGCGHGNALIDLLVVELKIRGVKRIGDVSTATYRQKYDAQLSKLVQRLRAHFPDSLPFPG